MFFLLSFPFFFFFFYIFSLPHTGNNTLAVLHRFWLFLFGTVIINMYVFSGHNISKEVHAPWLGVHLCSLQVFISVEPADEVSVQQCAIVLNSTGFPLIVNGWLILRCTTTVREESNAAVQISWSESEARAATNSCFRDELIFKWFSLIQKKSSSDFPSLTTSLSWSVFSTNRPKSKDSLFKVTIDQRKQQILKFMKLQLAFSFFFFAWMMTETIKQFQNSWNSCFSLPQLMIYWVLVAAFFSGYTHNTVKGKMLTLNTRLTSQSCDLSQGSSRDTCTHCSYADLFRRGLLFCAPTAALCQRLLVTLEIFLTRTHTHTHRYMCMLGCSSLASDDVKRSQ